MIHGETGGVSTAVWITSGAEAWVEDGAVPAGDSCVLTTRCSQGLDNGSIVIGDVHCSFIVSGQNKQTM